MARRYYGVAVVLLAALLIMSSVAGSQANHDRQVLGGALPGSDSVRQQRAAASTELLSRLSSAGNPATRALVVFRDYVAVDQVSAAVDGMPIHYLRAGLVGNRPAVLEHFTIQCGSETSLMSLQPDEFVEGYLARLLSREIAHYENGLSSGNLPPAASEYLQALRQLRHSAGEMIRIYAVGVTGSAADLAKLQDCDLIQVIDPVDPEGPRTVEYSPRRPR